MKLAFSILLTATLASAEPHPSYWTYVSPAASSLVGIQWINLRHSPFAATIEAQISPSGGLGFPDLDCLRQADEILISSPALLAAEKGSFPAEIVQDQAQRQGLRRVVYRGVTLWLPQEAEKLGVAQISEKLVLVGAQKTLETAIDGGLSEASRQDSPLLTRAAGFAENADLWVAALELPDRLAGRFVPLDAKGSEFLGRVTLRDGLAVQAFFDAGSEKAASEFVRGLRERAPSFPSAARGIEAATDRSRVTIALQVSSAALMAASRPALAPAAPQSPTEPEQPASPVKFAITHVEAFVPRIIRIFNLDEGTRETVLPPAVESLDVEVLNAQRPDPPR